MLIRNDDIAFDTDIDNLKIFCDICDRYGFKIIQCITSLGECKKSHVNMNNREIQNASDRNFFENTEVVDYLKSRKDLIAVHGLWHTHRPEEEEIEKAKEMLINVGFNPTYFVPPFNEWEKGDVCGLKTSKLSLEKGERLEDFLDKGTPTSEIAYLHSWRFGNWYKFEQLESCLKRLKQANCQYQNAENGTTIG